MKKTNKANGSSLDQPLASKGAAGASPPQPSKSDTPQRKSSSDKSSKPLNKTNYLSKSSDNLASQLRRKATAAALSQQKEAGNKENVTFKTPLTPKNKPGRAASTSTPGNKSPVTIDTPGTPIKRAQSAQNITKTPTGPNKQADSVKRASSTQNISGGKTPRQNRFSGSANMAYNAELLASFEKEKKALERRISELIQVAENRKTEIERLKFEVRNLKERVPDDDESLEVLHNENRLLKDRLAELGVKVEQVTDSEKLSLLKKASSSEGERDSEDHGRYKGGGSQHEVCDSVAGEIGTVDSELGLSVADLANWETKSNKSSDAMSEVSVACLQDRILQMEETHYSTNEELQATLQELTDLQDTVNDLTLDNERLGDERSVLLESLCAQTEKLENARMQIEHLKTLLLCDSENKDRTENEKQLVALLKSAQEEKEELRLALNRMEHENKELQDIITALRDKIAILEMKNESILADKRALDNQVTELKESADKDQIEIQRYKTLYDNEKCKVTELEQFRNATDKSDLEELLDNTRQEKDKVEEKLADIQNELAVSNNQVLKLKENLARLEEEQKVTKNNAKSEVQDLNYKMEKMAAEKAELQAEMDSLRDHIDQLQLDCDSYLEEKKVHNSTVGEVQQELLNTKQRIVELEQEIKDSKSRYQEEKTEWQQFQQDLQTAVVIANDIKTETQEDLDKVTVDNQRLKERNQTLEAETVKLQEQIDRLLAMKEASRSRSVLDSSVLTGLRAASRKVSDPWGQQQSQSVKNLIASIEHQVKSDRCTPPTSPGMVSETSSRRNSSDSSVSNGTKMESPSKPAVERRGSVPVDTSAHLRSALKKTPETKEARSPLSHRHSMTNIIYDKAPPTVEEAKLSPPGRSESDGGKKPITGIKSALRKSSTVYVHPDFSYY